MDFGSILGGIIAANERDSGDVNDVMESNRARTEKERSSADVIRDLTNRECFSVALEAHKVIEPFLCAAFAKRDQGRGEQMVELRGQYKARNDDWQAHCRRLDRIKDRIHRRRQATTTAPVTPSIDPSGLPFFPEPMTPGPSIVGRGNRRNPSTAFGYGDAVRSEAEFLEILASLETADMRDPNVRATRTAAIVPDMVLDETERRNILPPRPSRSLDGGRGPDLLQALLPASEAVWTHRRRAVGEVDGAVRPLLLPHEDDDRLPQSLRSQESRWTSKEAETEDRRGGTREEGSIAHVEPQACACRRAGG
jgi:hypothetical protein